MRSNRVITILVVLSLLVAGATAFAQGIPTATLSGKVLNEGQGLPGVSVSAKSPALQGSRSTVTGANGDYVFANVPPGDYTIVFAMSGFQPVTKSIKLSASQKSQLDAVLSLTAVAAEATVVGKSEAISQSTTEATTYTADLLSKLPTTRTINSAVTLSPGLNNNGPNGYSVAGAMSTENLYTINGVVVTDNVRNTLTSLYIEDAVQETTTSTSSLSAEYGRFTGGVINTITKSGGNTFSGSFRTTFTNDSWASTSAYRTVPTSTVPSYNPQEGAFINTVVPTYEATIGGPILKDKVWFFLAGRYYDTSDATTTVTPYTGISYTTGNKEPRYEVKLTLSPFQSHTLTASYIDVKTTQKNNWYTSAPIMDLASLYDRVLPQKLFAVNYNGVLTDSFFLDAQYSKKQYTFENSGSIYTDIMKGTLLLDRSRGNARYNSPTFCGVCTPEKRDNDNWLAKGTYFLSTPSMGSHNIVGGYDNFGGQRLSNNHQSGSDFRIYGTGAIIEGSGASAVIYPKFDTGTSTFFYYQPILQDSTGSDVRTQSGFVNDTWRLNNKISFNIGVRYDKNRAQDALSNVTSTDSAWSPRLAGTYDVKGDGKLKLSASYAKYVAAISENQAGSGYTPAGSPATYYWYYDGFGATPINMGASGPYLSITDALNKFWGWFGAGGCLPNPTLPGCKITQYQAPDIPGLNSRVNGSLASPAANEYTLGVAGTIGPRGTFRADIVRREFNNFYDSVKDMSTGKVTSPTGAVFDLSLIGNSNDYRREYTGLHTQFAYRFGDRINVGGNWTWSHLIGDIVGETSASGNVVGTLHNQPEYFNRAWNSPVGDLSSDQRHRVYLYGSYDVPVPAKYGTLNAALIQSWNTGTPYGASGSVGTRNYVTNPGYTSTPSTVTYWFTSRDAYRTEDVWRTDISATYSYKIGGAVELYVSPQIYNVFNAQHVIAVNSTSSTAANSSANYNVFNPFTTAPVECPQTTTASACKAAGANWQKGSLFGQPTGPTSYQLARTFQFSVGVRF